MSSGLKLFHLPQKLSQLAYTRYSVDHAYGLGKGGGGAHLKQEESVILLHDIVCLFVVCIQYYA